MILLLNYVNGTHNSLSKISLASNHIVSTMLRRLKKGAIIPV